MGLLDDGGIGGTGLEGSGGCAGTTLAATDGLGVGLGFDGLIRAGGGMGLGLDGRGGGGGGSLMKLVLYAIVPSLSTATWSSISSASSSRLSPLLRKQEYLFFLVFCFFDADLLFLLSIIKEYM